MTFLKKEEETPEVKAEKKPVVKAEEKPAAPVTKNLAKLQAQQKAKK